MVSYFDTNIKVKESHYLKSRKVIYKHIYTTAWFTGMPPDDKDKKGCVEGWCSSYAYLPSATDVFPSWDIIP